MSCTRYYVQCLISCTRSVDLFVVQAPMLFKLQWFMPFFRSSGPMFYDIYHSLVYIPCVSSNVIRIVTATASNVFPWYYFLLFVPAPITFSCSSSHYLLHVPGSMFCVFNMSHVICLEQLLWYIPCASRHVLYILKHLQRYISSNRPHVIISSVPKGRTGCSLQGWLMQLAMRPPGLPGGQVPPERLRRVQGWILYQGRVGAVS